MGGRFTQYFLLCICVSVIGLSRGDISFSILHTGDTRSNFLPIDASSLLECAPTYGLNSTQLATYAKKCIGGWDIRAKFIRDFRNSVGAENTLLIDAGDMLSGTLFFQAFNSTMIQEYTAAAGYNLTGLSSRDFDGGTAMFSNLVNYLNDNGVKTTSVSLNFTSPQLKSKVVNQVTMNIQGKNINIFYVNNVRTATLTKLPPGVGVLVGQELQSAMTETAAGNAFNIVVSKQSTLALDMELLRPIRKLVDIILVSYNGEMMVGSMGCVAGIPDCTVPYPLNATTEADFPLVVAAAPPLGTGIGVLNVTFDDSGKLVDWSGDSILFNRSVYQPDPVIEADLYSRKQTVVEFTAGVVGHTPVPLIGNGAGSGSPCRNGQCSFGALVADAMRNYSNVDIGLMSGGSTRANIPAGDITYGDILLALPFLNNVATFEILGSDLLDVLNYGFSSLGSSEGTGKFLQVSGLRVTYNPTKNDTMRRVILVESLNRDTGLYEEFDTRNTYSVACTNFQYAGGDGYNTVGLPGKTINGVGYGSLLTDVVIEFINAKVADNDGYFQRLDTDKRLIVTNLDQAFVPTIQPVIITFKQVPDGLVAAFTVVTGVLSIITIVVGAFIFHNRTHAVTVIASPVFCMIIIGGVLLSHLAVMIYMHVRNNAGCMTFPWLGNYAFVIIFGALFAKTWRIDMIFSRTKKLKTKKRAISNTLLFIIIGLMLLVETFIMGLWQGLSPLKYTFSVSGTESYYTCKSKNGVYFFAASIAYKALLMVWGMYLVIKTRNIDSDFRESTFIGWVIYAVFFTCAVIVTICLILKTNIVGVFVLIIIGFWIVSCAVIGAIFIPKLIEIISHPDLVWSVYFQRRAENIRQGGGSVFTKTASVAHDSIQDRMEGMSLTGLQALLEEFEMRHTSLKSSLADLEKDLSVIRAKIAKKQASAAKKGK